MSAADTHESGHSTGTVGAKTRAERGAQRRSADQQSGGPGWPRLLNIEMAALYLSVSKEVVRELINAGKLTPVRVPRPNTARAWRRRPIGDTLRRLLLDRTALDEMVDRWRTYGD